MLCGVGDEDGSQTNRECNVETMEKKLKKLEADCTNMEREKERAEERQEALEQVQLLEKKEKLCGSSTTPTESLL